jgi:hypothetical protein
MLPHQEVIERDSAESLMAFHWSTVEWRVKESQKRVKSPTARLLHRPLCCRDSPNHFEMDKSGGVTRDGRESAEAVIGSFLKACPMRMTRQYLDTETLLLGGAPVARIRT